MTSDRELLVQYCATRSHDVFDRIVERHGAMVLRACLRLLRNHHDAEDAAQLALIRLAQRPDAVDTNLGGWLYKVARDTASNLKLSRSRRARRERLGVRSMVAQREPDFDELREEFDAALESLPPLLREAVILHYLEGRTYEDAARIADCSETAFRTRSLRGLSRLREVLARRGTICGIATLTAFLGSESLAAASASPEAMWPLSHAWSLAGGPKLAAQPLLWGKLKVVAAVAIVGGGLTFGGIRHELRREAARMENPAAAVIDFADGFRSLDGLTANGFDGASPIAASALRLTDGRENQARSVFSSWPIDIRRFASTFRFRIIPGLGEGNGFTFCIQSLGPSAIGPDGWRLGYKSIDRSAALTFNLHAEEDGPLASHVKFDVNGKHAMAHAPGNLAPIAFDDGHVHEARIAYDGTVLRLQIVDLDDPARSSFQEFPADIPQAVGGPAAHVGFTAGSGWRRATQEILGWTYVSERPPAAPKKSVPPAN